MKKLGLVFLLLVLMLVLCECFYIDPVLNSLPQYKSKVFYTSGGFQDYTDYAKYTYDSITVQDLVSSTYFNETSAKDIQEITLYIQDFEEWVKTVGGELMQNYDFDRTILSEGDYFYIATKEGEPIGNSAYRKFDSYDIYYFDIDTQILYYFHNNI